MLTIQNLRAYGANVDDGVQRCLNDEGFYLEMVAAVFKDGNLSALEQALENKDAKTAFEYAHALKGVTANMALTPILTPVQQITELLRNRTQADYGPLLAEIEARRAELLG